MVQTNQTTRVAVKRVQTSSMNDAKVLLIVPFWKKAHMMPNPDYPAFIAQPFEDLPKALKLHGVMVDQDLKHEWAEDLDTWFHTVIVNRMRTQGGPIMWCSETEKSDLPDANS